MAYGIAATAGARLARHGARGLTSACGTVDVLEALGLDVDSPVPQVVRSIKAVGIGLFNGMSSTVRLGALGRILSQIRFGSTLDIAASLASPCRVTHDLRGVHRADAIDGVIAVMKAVGYQRAMVVHGWDADGMRGMDELSTLAAKRTKPSHPFYRSNEFGKVHRTVIMLSSPFAWPLGDGSFGADRWITPWAPLKSGMTPRDGQIVKR